MPTRVGERKMGNEIYVTLDDLVVVDDDKVVPVKPYDEGILDGSFRELIESMLDVNRDPVSGHEYNLEEKRFIERFKTSYLHAVNQPNSQLSIYAMKDETHRGPYNIDSRLADHRDEILNYSEVEEDDHKVPYRHIDLLVRSKSSGQ